MYTIRQDGSEFPSSMLQNVYSDMDCRAALILRPSAPYFHIARMRKPTSTRTCRVLRSPAALLERGTRGASIIWSLTTGLRLREPTNWLFWDFVATFC